MCLFLPFIPVVIRIIYKIYIITDVSYKNSIRELVKNACVRNFKRDEGDVTIEKIETLS